MKVTLSKNRVFADVTKFSEKKKEVSTHTERIEHHVKMEAQIGVMYVQAKECQALPENMRSW